MFVFCNSVSANPLLVKRIGVHLQDYTQQATQNGMVSFNSSSSFFLRKNESYLSPVCSSSSSLQNGWWPAALLCVGIFRSLVMFLKQEEEKAQLSKERRGGHRCWEKQDMDKNWSEATWTKMVEDSTFSRLCASLYAHYNIFSSVQFSSLAQSCPTLFDPMNRSTPGLPVHHKLPEFTQIHVHWDGCMASLTQWTWVCPWWWTGRPGMLRFMGSQRVGHDWASELNWTDGQGRNLTIIWLTGLFFSFWS